MMKKTIAYLAALMLLCALLPCGCAEEEEIPVCLPGDSVEVTFTLLENPSNAVAATMKLSYDHEAMRLIPSGTVENDSTFLLDLNGIKVGTAVSVGFQTLPDTPAGEYEITLDVVEAGDIDENYVTDMIFSVERVAVADLNAPEPEPVDERPEPAQEEDAQQEQELLVGDVTGDGKVDIFDAIRLRRYISGEDVEVNQAQCDVNGNGAVDIFDLIRLQKMLSQVEEN